jgi:hypothetical protein
MYSNFIISINGLNIMGTLDVYFEYIKILYRILTKYIVPILQVYAIYFILL